MIEKLGDKHNGEFVTTAFQNGRKCIKKPRPADNEYAYNTFLQMLENDGFLYAPGRVEIIGGTEYYHYVAITDHKELSNFKEINLYYKRIGALLFLSYIFSSVDLHRENLVAHGDKPTIIDYETLLTGDDSRIPNSDTCFLLSDSIWASSLLPRWKRDKDKEIDISGLTGHILNNEGICEFKENPNLPYFNGVPIQAYDFEKEILEGFSYSYDFFMENNKKIENWLSLFSECSFRVILRPTDIYYKLISYLKDLPKEQQVYEASTLLKRAYLNDIDPQRLCKLSRVLAEEIRSVTDGEIPLFTVKGNGIAICCRDEILYDYYFLYSPVEHAKNKLKSLSVQDKEGQLKIISQSLASSRPLNIKNQRGTLQKHIETHRSAYANEAKCNHELPLSCIKIFRTLEKKQIENMPDGWLYLNRGYSNSTILTGIGMGLYNGIIGILCFYAALYAKTKDKIIYESLMSHYKGIRSYLLHENIYLDSSAASLGIGIAGIILALYHISELSGNSVFIDDANQLFENTQIPKHLITGNTDLLGGYAGLPLALYKLGNKKKTREAAEILRPELRKITPRLTGFAHGASGYALALTILDYILEDHSSSDLIFRLLNWEDKFFDKRILNWIDLRPGKEKYSFMNGWCSGTPGIVMARSEILHYSDDHRIREISQQDIGILRRWLDNGILNDHDNLCCGTASRVMVASRLGIPCDCSYLQLLSSVKNNNLHLQHILRTNDFIPGLMQGLAGIGYALVMHGDNRSGGMLV